MQEALIYVLMCPDTLQIRYVGKATGLRGRYKNHCQFRRKPSCFRERWINKLIRNGKFPIIDLIDIAPANSWEDCERFWIRHFRSLKFPLTNTAEGGVGGCSYKRSKKTKMKMSVASKKRNAILPALNKLKELRKLGVHFGIKKGSKKKPISEPHRQAIRNWCAKYGFGKQGADKINALRALGWSPIKKGHKFSKEAVEKRIMAVRLNGVLKKLGLPKIGRFSSDDELKKAKVLYNLRKDLHPKWRTTKKVVFEL